VRGAVAPLLISNASRDERFCEHPGLKLYGIESYIAVPLKRLDGKQFGTLCALDPLPTALSEKDFDIFHLLAKLIAFELEAEERAAERERELSDSNRKNQMLLRFMSILGHDLRNPLNTISGAANVQKFLNRNNEKAVEMSDKILRSSRRMQQMITDLLDSTQSERGEDLQLRRKSLNLCEICEELIEEFRLANPQRKIELAAANCCGEFDETRFGQVLSNLLSNALRYGTPAAPVKVSLKETVAEVILSVNNQGKPISAADRENLFKSFWRGANASQENTEGLGLGLHIVEQIMRAHGGKIKVASDWENGTTFTAIFRK